MFSRTRKVGRRAAAAAARLEGLESRLLFTTFEVTNGLDDGPGSLRQAILAANFSRDVDHIRAVFPDLTVRPLSPLPVITGTVGLTGFQIDGTDAGPVDGGLVFAASAVGSSVDNSTITHFHGPGIKSSAPNASLSNVDVWLNDGTGVLVDAAGATLYIARSRIATFNPGLPDPDLGNHGDGVRATGGAGVTLIDSTVGYNDGVGIRADGPGTSVTIDNTSSVYNGSHGVAVTGGATLEMKGGRNLLFPGPDPMVTYRFNGISRNGGSGLYIQGPAEGTPRPTSIGSVIASDFSNNAGDGVTIVNADGVQFGTSGLFTCGMFANGGNGVTVRGRSERIDLGDADLFNNAGLAVDLGGDGPTANDAGDADAGPNALQNTPVLTSANWADDRVTVAGTINSTPNTTITLRFYTDSTNNRPDATGDGGYFINQTTVTTGTDGNATFSARLEPIPDSFPGHGFPGVQGRAYPTVGSKVRATATANSDTSEVSNAVTVGGGAVPKVLSVLANGSRWSQSFRYALYAAGLGSPFNGYVLAAPITPNAPEPAAPVWTGIDTITVGISPGAQVHADDLTVTGRSGPYAISSFSYDPSIGYATWRLARAIDFDRVTLNLDGDAGGVFGLPGNLALDGDADGRPGGDYVFSFNVIPGDVDHNGRVNALDLAAVRSKLNGSATAAGQGVNGYTAAADVNGNGRIDSLDLAAQRRTMAQQSTVVGVLASKDEDGVFL